MTLWQEAVIFTAAVLAGLINSIAGGGTLISFPTLLWIGRNPIVANATSTVALWPGSLAGVVGFRRDLAGVRRWLLLLMIPSFAGGIAGAVLLIHTSTRTFSRLVPFLILGATLLLAGQELIVRRVPRLGRGNAEPTPGWVAGVFFFQLLVGLYGGYFGAGIGILMLAALGLMGLTDLHQMNGLKNLLAICINGIAAVYFAVSGTVIWMDAISMAVGSICGGFLGPRLAHRLGRKAVRWIVVGIGLAMTVALFLKERGS